MNDQESFAIAVEEAKMSYKEGGVPVGILADQRPIIADACRLELHWSLRMADCWEEAATCVFRMGAQFYMY